MIYLKNTLISFLYNLKQNQKKQKEVIIIELELEPTFEPLLSFISLNSWAAIRIAMCLTAIIKRVVAKVTEMSCKQNSKTEQSGQSIGEGWFVANVFIVNCFVTYY